jgi:hypothetical protein
MTKRERIKLQRETICKGCIANINDDCSYLPIIHKGTHKEYICPCSTCLIKMICTGAEECKLMFEYYGGKYYDGERQNIN